MVNYSNAQMEQLEIEFNRIENGKEYSLLIQQKIEDILDSCINAKTYEELVNILPYYKDSAYILTGTTRKYYILYTITNFEKKCHDTSFFLDDVNNHSEAISKYIQSTLMLRRLTQNLPIDSINEAIDYLHHIHITPSAVVCILSNELFEDFEDILMTVFSIMQSTWTPLQNTWFAMHICEHYPTENNCLTAASYCLDNQDYKLALQYLLKIRNPSSQTNELITELQGAINE